MLPPSETVLQTLETAPQVKELVPQVKEMVPQSCGSISKNKKPRIFCGFFWFKRVSLVFSPDGSGILRRRAGGDGDTADSG